MAVSYKAKSYTAVTPYLVVEDGAKEIAFIRATFDALVDEQITGPGGRVVHAELRIDDAHVMLGEASADNPALGASLYVYVPDVDATYAKGMAAGAQSLREPTDEFYGDRSCGLKSPSGIRWWVATHLEDLSGEEIAKRASEHHRPAS